MKAWRYSFHLDTESTVCSIVDKFAAIHYHNLCIVNATGYN